MPRRIQRSRAAGRRIPAGAIYVGRPTKWGNPFVVGVTPAGGSIVRDNADAVARYRGWLADLERSGVPLPITELRGKDLVCWCPLDQPCHADVLLELANQ